MVQLPPAAIATPVQLSVSEKLAPLVKAIFVMVSDKLPVLVTFVVSVEPTDLPTKLSAPVLTHSLVTVPLKAET